SKELLGRRLAWRRQGRAFGGLDRESLTSLQGLARHGSSPRRQLKPGTVLLRDYHGQRHTVTVAPDGFNWQGTTYASLSAIARAITGIRDRCSVARPRLPPLQQRRRLPASRPTSGPISLPTCISRYGRSGAPTLARRPGVIQSPRKGISPALLTRPPLWRQTGTDWSLLSQPITHARRVWSAPSKRSFMVTRCWQWAGSTIGSRARARHCVARRCGPETRYRPCSASCAPSGTSSSVTSSAVGSRISTGGAATRAVWCRGASSTRS